jgi:hypothetical protein
MAETNFAFCLRLAKNCGAVTGADNCGTSRSVLSCGTCTSPNTCGGGGTSYVCGCTPETDHDICTRLGKNCGLFNGIDNCGAVRSVPDCSFTAGCTAPSVCSGGGVPNVCGYGCTGETDSAFCARLGKNCGSVTAPDNCSVSRTVDDCGFGVACAAPSVCGGAGSSNVCGCVNETDIAFCSRLGASCGSLTAQDTCGVTRTVPDCSGGPGCTAPNICGAQSPNVCGCTGETASQLCIKLGVTCGTATGNDTCGSNRRVYCGSCTGVDGGLADAGGNASDHTAFFTGDDVSLALKNAGQTSAAYLKVYITLTPSTDKLSAPTVTEFRQQFDCVPSQ